MFTVSRIILIFATVVLCGGLLLTGCKSDSSNPAGPGGPGTGGTITVTGKVIGTNYQPMVGFPVLVVGTTIPSVNTDANGTFSFANVTTPYSIAVIDGPNKQTFVYRGLTRSDPTIMWVGAAVGTQHSATLTGTIYPASAYPEPLGRRSKVAFTSTEVMTTTSVDGTTGTYTLHAAWYGPTTTAGSLHILQWDYDPMTSIPTLYRGYGVRSGITLLDATANPNGNDTMSVVSPDSLSGTVTVQSGYTLAAKQVSIVFGSTVMSLFADNSTSPNFAYLTPGITGATVLVTAVATKTGVSSTYFKTGLSPGASGVNITVPVAPELSLPIDATTGITKSSQFSWTKVPNAVNVLVLSPPAGQPKYYVLTAAAADSIPDLSSAGLGLPASTVYSWNVVSLGPFASVDAVTGPSGYTNGFNPTGTDGFNGRSSTRTFTTAP